MWERIEGASGQLMVAKILGDLFGLMVMGIYACKFRETPIVLTMNHGNSTLARSESLSPRQFKLIRGMINDQTPFCF